MVRAVNDHFCFVHYSNNTSLHLTSFDLKFLKMNAKEYFVARKVAEAVIIYNPIHDKYISNEHIEREWQSIAQRFDAEFAAEDADNELVQSKFNFTSFVNTYYNQFDYATFRINVIFVFSYRRG